MRRYGLLLLFSVIAGSAQAGVVYTPATGPNCRDYSKPQFGHWVCPGPGGYAAAFSDEGNMAAVAIGRRTLAPNKLPSVSQFRGANKVFGDKIEWHVRNGKPHAAVLRVWKVSDDDREVQQLEVYAIGRDASCLFKTVDAAQPGANEKAGAYAEEATPAGCIARRE